MIPKLLGKALGCSFLWVSFEEPKGMFGSMQWEGRGGILMEGRGREGKSFNYLYVLFKR
jgi:hypothetical protein